MPFPRFLRRAARVGALLLLALAAPRSASSLPVAPGLPELAPPVRAGLARAAADAHLAGWQRKTMRHLAAAGTPSPAAADPGALRPALATSADDGTWQELVPEGRESQSVVYDPVRDRIVVFGGHDGTSLTNSVWVLSLSAVPVWTKMVTAGTPPSPRYGHGAIVDALHNRMIVFGGCDSAGYRNDLWALSFTTSIPAWTPIVPGGTLPAARAWHSAIYDPVRERMIVYAGCNGFAPSYHRMGDVVAVSLSNLPVWTVLASEALAGPQLRYGHSAIYDPVRDRMVIFGGDTGGDAGAPWALSLGGTPAWTKLDPSGSWPATRVYHSAVYDPQRDRMLVYGGSGPDDYNDVWALSLAGGTAWLQLATTAGPLTGRCCHSAVYDPALDCMLVFGGYDQFSFLNDTWALGLSAAPVWTVLGTPPSGRWEPAVAYDSAREQLLLCGGEGSDGSTMFDDVWSYSLVGLPCWTPLATAGSPPGGRNNHSVVYDPARDRILWFGGRDAAHAYHNDVWALTLSGTRTWTQLFTAGTPPSARESQKTLYDPVRDRMLVIGGVDSSGVRNDLWALTLSGTPTWTPLVPAGTPPATRYYASTIYDAGRDRLVMFGGFDGTIAYNDVWSVSLGGTPAWVSIIPNGVPPSYRVSNAVYDSDRARMVVFGGMDLSGTLTDTYALSLAGLPTWSALAPAGPSPAPRDPWWYGAFYQSTGRRLVAFGGDAGTSALSGVWALAFRPQPLGVGDGSARPLAEGLRAPAPNPARGETAVSYAIARPGRVRIGVYDAGGRLVRTLLDGELRAGAGTVSWNGRDESGARRAAGVYFVRLEGPGIRQGRKLVVLE